MGVALLLVPLGGAARAAGPDCPSSVMYIAAHADDTLLFQSPSLLRDVRSGRCVQTVFLTAGDAGKAASYWEGREKGAEAGYAEMLGVPDQWSESEVMVDGHPIQFRTLDAEPQITMAYIRLPDGGPSGAGTPAYGDESLTKLWRSVKGGSPSVADIEAVDNSTSYDFAELTDALAEMMDSFGPRQIPTQDYIAPLVGPGDHADHVATGKFAEEATALYDGAHRLRGFLGYDSADEPANVFGQLLAEKSNAFYAYGAHDSAACADEEHCAGTDYEEWLAREYVADESTVGAVAHAGYPETVLDGEVVELDGTESSGESGDPLVYSWTQAGGTGVTLSGTATATPSFVAPPHAATLTFSLTVADGPAISESDFVTIDVDGPPPPDPPSPDPEPPASGPGSGSPPTGPIKQPGPPVKSKVRLSKGKVRLLVGRSSRQVVKVVGSMRPWVECRGSLPRGASCTVTAGRSIVIEGSKGIKKPGTFRLTVHVTDQAGTVQRSLIVQIRRPGGG